MDRSFIIDTETTGKTEGAQVIELARMELPPTPLEFVKGKLESFAMEHQRFGHTEPMQLGAMVTHSILPEELAGKELFKKLDYVGRYNVGHNVDFDVKMLDAVGTKTICTLALSRWMWPELDSHTQGAVLYHIAYLTGKGNVWARELLRNAHAADADVLNCARILKYILHKIMQTHELKGTLSWEDVYQISTDARIPKVMAFGKHIGKAVADVPDDYAVWYANCTNPPPDPYVLIALRRAGKLPE